MKKILLFILLSLLCVAQITYAAEYEIPDNFNTLMDQTYKTIYRYLEVDETLSYDLFLFDEYSLALSALSRGQISNMSLDQIKDYYHKNLDKYQPDENFLIMIRVYDANSILDLNNFATSITVQNSKNEFIYGKEFERYIDSIFIISFPKKQIEQLLSNDTTIQIQLLGKPEKLRVSFMKDYRSEIPAKITELVQILRETTEE